MVPVPASTAAPVAAANPGWGSVTMGTRSCSDSRWVINGIAAPPPTVATADRLATGILLRSNISPSASRKPASGWSSRLSSSARVTRTSDTDPGSSTGMVVAVSADSRSLAARHSPRSRVSEPTAAVPAGSASSASANTGQHVVEDGLVDLLTRQVAVPQRPRRWAAIPWPRRPARWWSRCRRSRTARRRRWTADRARSARAASAAAASEINSGGAPSASRSRLDRRAPRSAPSAAGPQYAGTAIMMRVGGGGVPAPTARASDSRASAVSASPRCADPSCAIRGIGSPTRSTNPHITMPCSVRFGFSLGRPTSGGRWSNSVRTDATTRGATTRALGHKVGRTDRQPERVAHCEIPLTSISRRQAAVLHHSGSRRAHRAIGARSP